ncbi:imidazole glycerol phosphate synthase subunit HisH [Leptospira sp. 2 VSF19]|uniref:Imidazole glycerol phosphate synthase subunit HisH n=2 Tax=Leptospira TaxID=171 RepID=A0AAW5VHC6_9LEPT|nr:MULTISPECIES: imidazole glycerol phosphate synthase subunit HisH [Leptospira]EOQ98036.1 imidazole glycerol phosphate synthase, glutamine amidotransferase subunit [Leptospira wolbachii serovar Codice str. CDC]MCW7493159.1 imidazole glycerol phosphate synthase subunit HisH [Leptospira soteropolitanensis]MCW7500772.1 imidazole glycerol phosphate synthase subunit HisH [Leptospira soteropolitanensis]MCW7523009.1 imidazole glycerol phosphate synthase subunit HisH [Leptospira soteropolitanensis]MC
MKVGVINYGMGNLGSVVKAVEDIGFTCKILNHPKDIWDCARVILPGVGSFFDGMSRLKEEGWNSELHRYVLEDKNALLGICLGMQMLATFGEEGGGHEGLGLIPGRVERFDKLGCSERIPHVGWNEIEEKHSDPLFAKIPDQTDFYFVHSFVFNCEKPENITSTCLYGIHFPSSVRNGNVMGVQFHPEKSSKAGRQLLLNFLEQKEWSK